MADDLEMWIDFVRKYDISAYIIVSITAIVVYDYLLGIGKEVDLVWGSKFSSGTLIYLVNRYSIFGYMIAACLHSLMNGTVQSCNASGFVMAVSYTTMILAQAAFASLRMFAIWNRNWSIALCIFALYCAPLVLQWVKIRQDRSIILPLPGCFTDSHYLAVFVARRVMSLMLDALILLLTWAKTYTIWRDALSAQINAPVSVLLLRDGTLHFSFLFFLSLGDLVMSSMASTNGNNYLAVFLPAVRSITVAHFILHLRAVYLDSADDGNRGRSSILRFATSVAANLGAPLEFTRHHERHTSDDSDDIPSSPYMMSHDPLAAGVLLSDNEGLEEGYGVEPREALPGGSEKDLQA